MSSATGLRDHAVRLQQPDQAPSWRHAVRQRVARWQTRGRRWSWRLRGWLGKTVTIASQQGRLTVYTADQVIGRSLYCHHEFELDWTTQAVAFLRQTGRLPPRGSGTVLDVGANLGVISIGLLYSGEFQRAIAIEPEPNNFALLQHNARQNAFSEERYRCLRVAASDRDGELAFELSPENFGDHRVRAEARDGGEEQYQESARNVIRVRAEPLDQILDRLPRSLVDDIALVWLDTQGHEGSVFRGGPRLFGRPLPVATEIWPYGLRRAGFRLEEFCCLVSAGWSTFWRRDDDGRFVARPTSQLIELLQALDDAGSHDNVLLTSGPAAGPV